MSNGGGEGRGEGRERIMKTVSPPREPHDSPNTVPILTLLTLGVTLAFKHSECRALNIFSDCEINPDNRSFQQQTCLRMLFGFILCLMLLL